MWRWWGWGCGAALVAAICARKLASRGWGRCTASADLTGRTCVITGANSGLGEETARQLAARGARVVLACRNTRSGERIAESIRAEHPSSEAIVMQLDLESFDSIRSFAKRLRNAFDRIHLLVVNAGIALPVKKYDVTKEGHEAHFGVNHLGHFLLVKLVLELLENGAPSRIVIVSSLLHEKGVINFQDLNLRKMYDAVERGDKALIKKLGRHHPGYCNSKLMNVYFGRALAERTRDSGVNVYITCPGFTYTNLFRHSLKWYHFILMAPIMLFFMRTTEQGVQTILNCAINPQLQGESGSFYRNCERYESKIKFDKKVEVELWNVSEELVEKKYELPN